MTKTLLGYQPNFNRFFIVQTPKGKPKLFYPKKTKIPYYVWDFNLNVGEDKMPNEARYYQITGFDIFYEVQIRKNSHRFLTDTKDSECVDLFGNIIDLNTLFSASIDKKNKDIKTSLTKKGQDLFQKEYKIFLKIVNYGITVSTETVDRGVFIEKEDWLNLVKNNFEYIDNSNNYLAQSLSYGSKPIYKIN